MKYSVCCVFETVLDDPFEIEADSIEEAKLKAEINFNRNTEEYVKLGGRDRKLLEVKVR